MPDSFFVISVILIGVLGGLMVYRFAPKSLLHNMGKHKGVLTLVAVTLMSLSAFAPTYAQSDTFTVDTSSLISSTNTWMQTLMPLLSIGFGISMGLAILYMIYESIMKGLRNRG